MTDLRETNIENIRLKIIFALEISVIYGGGASL